MRTDVPPVEGRRLETSKLSLLELIDWIYDAALDSDGWQRVTDELARAFGNSPVIVYLQLPDDRVEPRQYRALFDKALDPVFDRHWKRGLPWGHEAKPEVLEGFAQTSDFLEGKSLADTAFYREWMEPNGLAPIGPLCHVFATKNGKPVASVGIHRRLGRDRFEPWEIELADRLLPHLRRAWRIQTELSGLERKNDVLAEVIDRAPTGVILLDRECQIVATSRSAAATLEHGVGLLVRNGRLRADQEEHDRALQELMERLAQPDAPSAGDANTLAIPHTDGRRTIQLLGVPVRAPARTSHRPEAVATLFIGDPDLLRAASGDLLRSLYGLTRAEAELSRLLGDGLSVTEVARARGVAENTVRSQLKQVFAKTNTRRHAEVVRLVLNTTRGAHPNTD